TRLLTSSLLSVGSSAAAAGGLGGLRFGPGAAGGELTAAVGEVSSDEPVVLLKGGGLGDHQILGHRIEVAERLDGIAMRLDHAGVHHVERAEVRRHGVAAEGVVVPA